MKNLAIVVLLGVLLSACASSPQVQVRTDRDKALSCAGLADELGALAETEKQIQGNKSTSGKNILGLLLWLPGYVYTQANADEALRLVEERRRHLQMLIRQKGC